MFLSYVLQTKEIELSTAQSEKKLGLEKGNLFVKLQQYIFLTFFDKHFSGKFVSEEKAEVSWHLPHKGRPQAMKEAANALGVQDLTGEAERSNPRRLQSFLQIGLPHGLKTTFNKLGGAKG